MFSKQNRAYNLTMTWAGISARRYPKNASWMFETCFNKENLHNSTPEGGAVTMPPLSILACKFHKTRIETLAHISYAGRTKNMIFGEICPEIVEFCKNNIKNKLKVDLGAVFLQKCSFSGDFLYCEL
tara:strand:- start:219 stop:599 length:381 start_codon:yes stop_codon:yes gene_type:complete